MTQIPKCPDSFLPQQFSRPPCQEDGSSALLNTCRCVLPVGNPASSEAGGGGGGVGLQAFTRPLPCLECVPRASCTLRDLAFHQLCRGPWCPSQFDCQTFASSHASLDAPASRFSFPLSYVASEPCRATRSCRSMKHFFFASRGIGLWTSEWTSVGFCTRHGCIYDTFLPVSSLTQSATV